MTDLRTAAQQALEALEWYAECSMVVEPAAAAMNALRAALAEPVQEPVAWAVYDIKHGGSKTLHWPEQHSPNGDPEQFKAVPLYSAPPQRKPLTEEEIDELAMDEDGLPNSHLEFARAIERAHGIGDSNG